MWPMADPVINTRLSLGDHRPEQRLNEPPRGERENGPRPGQELLRLVLLISAGILALFIVYDLVMQFWVMPSVRISNVRIESSLNWTKEQVLSLAGLEDEPLFFSVDVAELEARLQAQPILKEVKVSKAFPDTLVFNLTARRPLLQHVLGDGTVVLLDVDGVAYDYVQTRTAYDIPILSGVEFRNFSPGVRLPSFILPFLLDLAELRDKTPALYQAFSEFRLEPKRGEDVEILVFAVSRSVPVRISPRLSSEGAGTILRVLDMQKAGDGFAGISEIDFRSKHVVIKKGDS